MTDSLGADVFVASLIDGSAKGLMNLLPAIIFVIGCLLAFATGTSWGTFGILIPIVVNAFQSVDPDLMIIAISACIGRRGMRRPLLPDFGYYDYGFRGRSVRARQPRNHADSLCDCGCCDRLALPILLPDLPAAP